MEEAVIYNKKHAPFVPTVTFFPEDSVEFAIAVMEWQLSRGLEGDGKLGPTTLAYIRQEILEDSDPVELGLDDYKRIVRLVSKFEGKFWSVNRDGEFRGLFDRDKIHWASGKTHIGLSFGFIQFTQDSGALGKLLLMMADRHPRKFIDTFEPHFHELLVVTNAKGKDRVDGRSPRVQPVGGHDLWSDYWVDKFRKAGRDPDFQECQIDLAIKDYMYPAIKTCKSLGLSSERALAIVFDRTVQYGAGGAKKLIRKAGGPEEEHLRLLHLLKTWKSKRWNHRVKSLYMSQTLTDSTCVFG